MEKSTKKEIKKETKVSKKKTDGEMKSWMYYSGGYFEGKMVRNYYNSYEDAHLACKVTKGTTMSGGPVLNKNDEIVGMLGVGMFISK